MALAAINVENPVRSANTQAIKNQPLNAKRKPLPPPTKKADVQDQSLKHPPSSSSLSSPI